MKTRLALPVVVAALLWSLPAFAQSTIAIGDTVSGTLDGSEEVDPNRNAFADYYTLSGNAGSQVEITMQSDVFDTYLYLLDGTGEIIGYDDDSAGSLEIYGSKETAR